MGFRAGAEFSYGRESKNVHDEGWDKYKKIWSPEKPDKWTMGTSVLWNSENSSEPESFPAMPWAMPVAKNYAKVNGEWQWEFVREDLDQIQDGEEIRDHMFRAIYGSFSNGKEDAKHANTKLKMGWLHCWSPRIALSTWRSLLHHARHREEHLFPGYRG